VHHPALRVASADGWSENYARHRNARFAIALFTRTERYSIEFVSWKRVCPSGFANRLNYSQASGST
jgi:hypothetical protein